MSVRPVPVLWRTLYCQSLKIHAVLLLALGRNSSALDRFDRLLKLRPLDLHALASRAHLQTQLPDWDGAIASLRLLTTACPHGAAGWFNLGYALQHAGQCGEAESAFRRALALDAQMDRAWYGLALLLMRSRQFNSAVDALEKNIALQPMSPYGWYRLAQVRLALGQSDEVLSIIGHLRQFEPRVAAQLTRESALSLSDAARLEQKGGAVPTEICGVAGHAAG